MDPLQGLQGAMPMEPLAAPAPTMGMPYEQQYAQRFGKPNQTLAAGMQILQTALNALQGLIVTEGDQGNPAIPEMQLPTTGPF